LNGNGLEVNLPYIPKSVAFYLRLRDTQYGSVFRGLEGSLENSCGITMEYIRPFTKDHIGSLLKLHLPMLPLSSIPDERDFLVKVFMGDTKPSSYESTVEFRNCAAYADHLCSERVNPQDISITMGNALAILHWQCGIDAAGVKFVFGRDIGGNVQLWLMDFGGCKTFQLSPADIRTQLVDAVLTNEPYWPRYIDLPWMRVAWTSFKFAYHRMSKMLLKHVNKESRLRLLPGLFMDELETRQGPRVYLGANHDATPMTKCHPP